MSPKKNSFNFNRGVQSLKIPKKKKIAESERSLTTKHEGGLKISAELKEEDNDKMRGGKGIEKLIEAIEEK